MKFGMLHLFESPVDKTEHQVMKEQLDLMRSAEDLGFDSVWPAEHHFSDYGYCASPALSLAAIASVTKRIRLGTGVIVLPFHNPIRVAEELAMLDLMSDGRLDFGVGRGYQPLDLRASRSIRPSRAGSSMNRWKLSCRRGPRSGSTSRAFISTSRIR